MKPVTNLLARWRRRGSSSACEAGSAVDEPEVALPAFDPLDPAILADPYPAYAALREHDPIHRAANGHWIVTRYEDVARALDNPSLGNAPSRYAVTNERNRGRYTSANVANQILPFLDPPHHAVPRRLVGRAFNGSLRRRPLDMQGLADRLLQPYRERGEIELVNDFGLPFSMTLIGEVLGVPKGDLKMLKEWSEWFFYLFAPMPSDEVRVRVDQTLDDFRDYFSRLVAERRKEPREDLISDLIAAETAGRRLGEGQLVDTCMLLFADGVENIDSGLSVSILSLLRHPEALDRLRAEPALLPRAASELLRYDSPAQFVARTAREDLSLCGHEIRENEGVLLMLASANRDSSQIDRADSLVLDRDPNPLLTFGKGAHACIGAPFATQQFAIALGAVLSALPNPRLATGELDWVPRLGHRWLRQLPIEFDPTA